MATPVRYPSGVTNREASDPSAMLPILDPTKHNIFYDDFHAATLAAANITGWHEDAVNAGTSLAVGDAEGGVATFVLDNADGDNYNYQWGTNTTVHETFKIQAGKKAWLRVKFKTEDADTDIVQAGLHVAADDVLGTEPADQFWFRTTRADPDGLIFAAGKTDSTEVTISLGNLADDTWAICTAYYDGKNTVHAWRESSDGVVTNAGSVSVTSSTAGDLLPDTEMTVGFGMEATDTGTDIFSIDYILVVTER